MTINFRIEYGSAPIRHIAVQCPHCGKWYRGRDITKDDLSHDYDVEIAKFKCPICETIFSCHNWKGYNLEVCGTHVEECWSDKEVYAGCLTRKEVWE